MSTLAVSIPPRPRLRAGAAPTAGSAPTEFAFTLSADGLSIERQGYAAPALLPRADHVVAVLSSNDVSWHRITCPKAPAARMAAALSGVLEDAVLDDASTLHFALAPGAKGGEPTWVAATDRAWLAAEIAVLEAGGLRVDRVVPSAWPDEPPWGHFHESAGSDERALGLGLALTWAHADGVATWPLQGSLARTLLPQPLPAEARFTATPAVAAPAERWLGTTVQAVTPHEHALQAARSLWNLRQFALAPQHRGMSALADVWRRLRGPSWRPARWGLAALVVVQLLGLNLAAWQQRRALESRRDQMAALLLETHPQVRAVLDAPAQMQRETDTLRAAAGRAGKEDLESALQAAASAWPQQQPVQTLGYEGGRLTLATPGWTEPQVARFRELVEPAGWRVEAADGRLTMSRAGAAGADTARSRG
jgi:general secretion pathway protein L